jgi:hypothetical protein
MLLHSREGSGEHRPVDINAIVDEALKVILYYLDKAFPQTPPMPRDVRARAKAVWRSAVF